MTCQKLLTHIDTNGSFMNAKFVHVKHILVTFMYIMQHIMGYINIKKNVTFVSKKDAQMWVFFRR
jgi:hypothetical protein